MATADASLPSRAGLGRRSAYVAMALSSLVIALLSYRYLPGVGPVPPLIAGNTSFNPFMALHVAGAATALLVGPMQFLPAIRRRVPALHRWLGRVYVAGCIGGGLAGLVLAFGASTGPISTAGFGLLALFWIATTFLAWRYAVKRHFASHRAFMIRSFALTFAAVTLRIYLPIGGALPVDFQDAYRAISFLCWVPNLIVAEWYLRRPATRGLKA